LSKQVRTALLVWSVFSLWPSDSWAQQSARSKHVLVLYWDDPAYPANIDFARSFRAAVESAAPGAFEYYSEYLESNRFPSESQSVFLRDYMRQKYAARSIDVVVTNASPPLDFLFKYRADLFPHTPIVFAATERPTAPQLTSGAGATGTIYVNSYRKTLDLAMKLHPGTQHIFVVSGATASGESWERMARNDLQGFHSTAAITYLTDLPLDDLTKRLRALPEQSIVLYVWQMLRNRQGTLLQSREVLALIAPSVRVPIYGMSFANVGLGIVGGYVWTMEAQAAKLAELMLKVVNGARPSDIPVTNTPVVPMFDWRQLQRWRIAEDRLPQASIVRFHELTMWQHYKWRIVGTIVLFALQALLIGALLAERHRARRSADALASSRRVLQESEERFRRMADTAPVLIWVSGPDRLCTFFNKGWLDFTGRSVEQEIGNGWLSGVYPEDLDRCLATYSSSFDARRSFQMEYRLRRADGEYRWILDSAVPLYQEDVFAGYVGSCIDITEQRRAEAASRRSLDEIAHMNRVAAMGELTASIAHEVNQPLAAILSNAQAASRFLGSESPDLAQVRDCLTDIVADDKRAGEVIRRLRSLLKRGTSQPSLVDLNEVVSDAIRLMGNDVMLRNVSVKVEPFPGLPAVRGDRIQLYQLALNLIMNGLDAVAERSPGDRWVLVRTAKADGGGVELTVEDSGNGVAASDLARVFEPFFSTKREGLGIGLSISRSIVQAHGGKIWVENSARCGAIFHCVLPVAQQAAVAAAK
jgi:PAS domain S-box-containing protein